MFRHAPHTSATVDTQSSIWALVCPADMHGRNGGADPG